jgi:tetratricopeptide (TPR) repeat protein
MKRSTLTVIALTLLLVLPVLSQENSCDQAYIKAMTTADAGQRAKLLKDYLAQCGGKGSQYENFAYANLCVTPYGGKTAAETIEFGEKAITLGGLDDLMKFQVLVTVTAVYGQQGTNLAKAKNYAQQAIQLGKAQNNNQWVGAGYYVQGQVQQKSNDLKGASNSYISAYNILKNPQIANDLKKVAKGLYDAKAYGEAAKAWKVCITVSNDYPCIVYLANSLNRSGQKDEALTYYKQAYTKQKKGDVAYNMGVILASKSNSNNNGSREAITYLLDASFLSEANSKKAMDLAQRLFFNHEVPGYNEKIKDLSDRGEKIEALTKSFNDKFGEKDEEDLSDAEKTEMEKILKQIEAEQKAIEKLQAEQQQALEKFNALVEGTKTRLGI